MTTRPPPLPPLPPNPPLPPQQQQQQARSLAIPRKCHPKIESFMALHESLLNKQVLQDSERQALASSELGSELQNVFHQCGVYRARTRKAKETFENNTTCKEAHREYLIQHYQLSSCLSKNACPGRYRDFANCWGPISSEFVQQFKSAGMEHMICQSERQALERCVGNLVSQAVRETTLDDDERDI